MLIKSYTAFDFSIRYYTYFLLCNLNYIVNFTQSKQCKLFYANTGEISKVTKTNSAHILITIAIANITMNLQLFYSLRL